MVLEQVCSIHYLSFAYTAAGMFLCLFLSEPAAKINRASVIWYQMCDYRE